MTPEPQVGDIVDITIRGARVIATGLSGTHGNRVTVAIPTPDGETVDSVWIDLIDFQIMTTPADEIRQAATKVRTTDLDWGINVTLAELFDHIADDMSDNGAREETLNNPAAKRQALIRTELGDTRFDWTAALDLARILNRAPIE